MSVHFERRAHVLLLALGLLLGATHAQGQVPPPLAAPDLVVEGPAQVSTVLRLTSGKLLVAGQFHYVDGTDAVALVRLNTDGSRDPGFISALSDHDSRANVSSLAVDGNGRIYAGGSFETADGIRYLVRLNPDGSVDQGWNPDVNYIVTALALDEAGTNLYIGGVFTFVKGQAHQRLAKIPIAGNGTPDAAWVPTLDQSPFTMTVSNSFVYVGGTFSSVNGNPRSYLARLGTSGSGAFDNTWNPAADNWVYAIKHDPISGKLLIGGIFGQVGGLSRSGLARVSESTTGAVDVNWNPIPAVVGVGYYGFTQALEVDEANSRLYVGGYTLSSQAVEGPLLARVSLVGTGAADGTFAPQPDGWVTALALQPAGIYAGGRFAEIQGQLRESVARVNDDGSVDSGFAARVTDHAATPILAIAERGDVDETYIGGMFTRIDGQVHRGLAKLVGGAVDHAWHGAVGQGRPRALAIAGDGALIVAGKFASASGLARVNLARLARDTGSADANFHCDVNGEVLALASSGGKIYVGGSFGEAGDELRSGLAKVDDTTGSVDLEWNPGADGYVSALAIGAAGKLYAAGGFATIGGATRRGIAKLSGTGVGAAEAGWDPQAGNGVYAYSVGLDPTETSVYVGGVFPSIGGFARNAVVKLSAGTGALDAGWDPGFSSNPYIRAIVHDGHGGLVVMGLVLSVGGEPRSGLARVDATGSGAVDSLWVPTMTPFNNGFALGLNANGGIDVGGTFSQISAVRRAAFARLPAATSVLAVTSDQPDPSKFGQAYSMQASLSSSFATPTGSVTFDDGAGNNCSAPVSSGAVSCSLSATPVGVRVITASFVPDGESFSTSEDTAQHTVQKALTTLSLGVVPATVDAGVAFTLTPSLSVTAPGGGTPTGSVIITVDGQTVCSKSLAGALACQVTIAAVGVHSIAASYAGDGGFVGAAAAAAEVTVNAHADLSITMDDGVAYADDGLVLQYTVGAANDGPDAVSGANLLVTPSILLTAVTWTCQGSGGAVCPHASGNGAISEVLALPASAGLVYILTGTAPAPLSAPISSSASIGLPPFVLDADSTDRSAVDTDASNRLFSHGFE